MAAYDPAGKSVIFAGPMPQYVFSEITSQMLLLGWLSVLSDIKRFDINNGEDLGRHFHGDENLKKELEKMNLPERYSIMKATVNERKLDDLIKAAEGMKKEHGIKYVIYFPSTSVESVQIFTEK